ncbi:hypothetical protein SRHO_G00302320 [Serrasalmus rhombeus]
MKEDGGALVSGFGVGTSAWHRVRRTTEEWPFRRVQDSVQSTPKEKQRKVDVMRVKRSRVPLERTNSKKSRLNWYVVRMRAIAVKMDEAIGSLGASLQHTSLQTVAS